MLDFSGWADWTCADRPYVPRYPPAQPATPPATEAKAEAPKRTFPHHVGQIIRETLAERFPAALAALAAAFEHYEQNGFPLRT